MDGGYRTTKTMHTRDGRKVTNLTFNNEINRYIGSLNGKPLTWLPNGRRTDKNLSKLDLTEKPRVYINLKSWGGEIMTCGKVYPSQQMARKNRGRGFIKTIEVEL